MSWRSWVWAWTVAVSRGGGGRTGTRERGDAGTLTGAAGNSWVKLVNGGRFDLDPEVSFDGGAVTLFVLLVDIVDALLRWDFMAGMAVAEVVGLRPTDEVDRVEAGSGFTATGGLYIDTGRILPAFAGPLGAKLLGAKLELAEVDSVLLLPPPPMSDFDERSDMVLPKRPLECSPLFPFSESCFEDRNDIDIALPSLLVDSSPFFPSDEPVLESRRRDSIFPSPPFTPDFFGSSDFFDRALELLAMLRRLIVLPLPLGCGGGGILVASNSACGSPVFCMPGDRGGERRILFDENILGCVLLAVVGRVFCFRAEDAVDRGGGWTVWRGRRDGEGIGSGMVNKMGPMLDRKHQDAGKKGLGAKIKRKKTQDDPSGSGNGNMFLS